MPVILATDEERDVWMREHERHVKILSFCIPGCTLAASVAQFKNAIRKLG
jgi:hypothetical protein